MNIDLKAYALRHAADPRISAALEAQEAAKGAARSGSGSRPGERAERKLLADLRLLGLDPQEQYCWAPGRKYRSDAAFPAQKLLIECDGRVHGVHEDKRLRDMARSNLAASLGWTILRYSPAQALDGSAALDVARYLEARK